MNKIAYFLLPIFIAFQSLQAVPNYPFPTNNTYFAGVITPSNVSKAQMDQKIRQLYDEWKEQYLTTVPGAPDQLFVFYNQDMNSDPKNAVSVSEGQGYGMMLAVYMAGHDPEAQIIFNKLFNYYEAFQSVITEHLMGWQQVLEDGEIVPFPDGGDDSATDGDLDIAYALLLANLQWGSTGEINYLDRANKMIDSILEGDVNLEEFTLKLGDWVDDDDEEYGKATRPSDFAINHLRNFAASSGDSEWQSVITQTFFIINELFDNFSPTTGLLPDFAEFKKNTYVPADEDFLERIEDGYYSWNACRTPWRIATDYILTGDDGALDQLTALNSWVQTKAKQKPANIRSGYLLNGTAFTTDKDLAFVVPFAVSAMVSADNQAWLNTLWTYSSARPTSGENYFANTIRLLCFLVVSGNWWTPINLPN